MNIMTCMLVKNRLSIFRLFGREITSLRVHKDVMEEFLDGTSDFLFTAKRIYDIHNRSDRY